MPTWLPQVLVMLTVGALQTVVTVALLGERIKNLTGWMKKLDETKVDKAVHAAEIDGLRAEVSGAYEEISRERHRMNNMEQRSKT